MSLWRLFKFGAVALTVGIIGIIAADKCRNPNVRRRLRDTPRKRLRTHFPTGTMGGDGALALS